MDPALAGSLAVVLSAAITLAGVLYTQRAARRAAEETADLEQRKVDAQAYESAKRTWSEHVEVLRGEVALLRARLRELDTEQERCNQRIMELTRWGRGVVRVLDEREIEHPPLPGGR
jgi:predicted RNase H-like nuclease (RuvC/YqgF family)